MWLNTSFHPVDGLSGAVKNCVLLASVAVLLVAAGWDSMNTPMAEAQPQGKLYVAVRSSRNGAILRFDDPAMLTGKVTATAIIAGDLTRLDRNTVSMALDPVADRLFVLEADTSRLESVAEILVFDHISTRSGNTYPDRVITGPATGMNRFGPIALDPIHDVLYVAANIDAGSHAGIVTFRYASAASGNVPPNSILKMSDAAPAGAINDLALDAASNRLFVLTKNQTIHVADNASTLASGTLTPDRVITSSAGFTGTTRIALDPAGRLLVGNTSGFIGNIHRPAHITILANAATAHGDVSPVATISGSVSGINVDGPRAMTIMTGPGSSAGGDLYVDVGSGTVLVFKNIAAAKLNILPARTFTLAGNGNNNLELSRNTSR